MKSKYQQIEISPKRAAILGAATQLMTEIWQEWKDANSGNYLNISCKIATDWQGNPNVWWDVHPAGDCHRSGYETTLPKALTAMHGKTDGDVLRSHAESYKREAARLEAEAKEAEAGSPNEPR